MKRTIHLVTMTATLCMASQAFAWVPSYYRCTFDQITSADQSRGRQKWAQLEYQQNDYRYNCTTTPCTKKDSRFWSPMFTEETTIAFEEYNTYLYPVYTDPATLEPWLGPGAYGTSTAGLTGDQINVLGHSFKPQAIFHDGVCEPGCYTPDQQILFETGPATVLAAQSEGREDLLTLSPDATFDEISYVSNPVERYTLDKHDAKQDINIFRMRSGGSLTVTDHHALVNSEGAISKAMDFVVGDFLVKQDGTLDEIVSIEHKTWYGKVYNLQPVSKDLVSNILVAQGYLNGSSRYQSEYVQEMNRTILRKNVPDILVPSN